MIRIEETKNTLTIIDNDCTEHTIEKINRISSECGKTVLVDFEIIYFTNISNDEHNQFNVDNMLRSTSSEHNNIDTLRECLNSALNKKEDNSLDNAVQLKVIFV